MHLRRLSSRFLSPAHSSRPAPAVLRRSIHLNVSKGSRLVDRILPQWLQSGMGRRYLNLVMYDSTRRLFPVCRIDLRKHLFYESSEIAARENNKKKSKRGPFTERRWMKLPPPAINFEPGPSSLSPRSWYLFSLLGGESSILYSNPRGRTVLHDMDANLVDSLPSPSTSDKTSPICIPIATNEPDGDDHVRRRPPSLYVLDLWPYPYNVHTNRCFEVLSYGGDKSDEQGWRWDALPTPPFLRDPETAPHPDIDMCSYAVVAGGSTICISYVQQQETGTYAFDTVRRRWRRAGDWVLPFYGRAEYVPELGLWFGLSASSPFSSLSAVDLSGVDGSARKQQPPPMPLHTWDYLDLPEDEEWSPSQLHLLNLGSGSFCVATFFGTLMRTCPYPSDWEEEDRWETEYAVFTGLEVKRSNGGEGPLELIKHMSQRYSVGSLDIDRVL